jgi:hypothetical protein
MMKKTRKILFMLNLTALLRIPKNLRLVGCKTAGEKVPLILTRLAS